MWSGIVLAAATTRPWRRHVPPILWNDAGTLLLFALLVFWLSRRLIAAQPTLDATERLAGLELIDYFFAHWHDHRFVRQPACDRCRGHHAAGHEAGLLSLRHVHAAQPAFEPAVGAIGIGARRRGRRCRWACCSGCADLYALAAASAGIGPAFLSVWIMACMPDASHFLLHNGFYGFHWLMFTAPGAGYAIGTAAIAILGAQQWFAEQRALPLLLTLLLARRRSFSPRPHVPAAGAGTGRRGDLGCAAAPVARRGIRLRSAHGVRAEHPVVAGVLGSEANQLVSVAADFISFAFNNNGPPAYGEFLRHFGRGTEVLVGALLLLPATLGLWAIAMPLVAVWSVIRREFRPADWIPGLLCLVYLLLIIWAPPGEQWRYRRVSKHFGISCCSTRSSWCGPFIVAVPPTERSGALARRLATHDCRGHRGGVLVFATLLAYRDVDPAKPPAAMDWAGVDYAVPVEPGIPAAAAFIRDHALVGDIMAVGGKGADRAPRRPCDRTGQHDRCAELRRPGRASCRDPAAGDRRPGETTGCGH